MSAEDTLDVGEIQNLAECISEEIKRVTIDVKLHVTVRLEIQGKPDIPAVTVEKVNEQLKKVVEGFQLHD